MNTIFTDGWVFVFLFATIAVTVWHIAYSPGTALLHRVPDCQLTMLIVVDSTQTH